MTKEKTFEELFPELWEMLPCWDENERSKLEMKERGE